MSIFSSIRKSRQSAKEHNNKLAEQKKQEGDKVVYKHVPTHAATDAYASAPPGWREADRPRIVEQNRRRSAMAASGHHMNMPGIPRVGSSLSHVSFPTDDTSPMVRMRMPRAYSYNGVSPYVPYPDRNREVLYSVPDLSYRQPSLKGKEVSRTPGSETPRISPTSSKGEHSPSRSESGSTSSQDGLEMKNGHAASSSTASAAAAAERAHRLHPSHSRHASDASAMGAPVATQSLRDSRPPPSTRGFASIPAKALAVPNISSDASSSGSTNSNLAGNSASRQSSTVSLPGLTPASSRAAHSNPTTPAAVTMAQPEFPLNATVVALPTPDAEVPSPLIEGVTPTFVTPGKFKDRRVSKTTRFTELERIDSNVEPAYFDHPQSQPPPAAVLQPEIVNAFPEPVAEVVAAPSKSKSKSKKLTKGGGKLVKKSRAVAV